MTDREVYLRKKIRFGATTKLWAVLCAFPLVLLGGCASFEGYGGLEVYNGCTVKVKSIEQTHGIDEATKITITDKCTVTINDNEKASDIGLQDIDKK
jgi:hypothetical protein